MPIDQEQVTKAIQTDSKLSKTLYESLGEDVNKLKTAVKAQVSRGIAAGLTWNQVAENLAKKNMQNTPYGTAINNAIRISRTEGHRVQVASAMDAQEVAKSKGADILKQWNAALDGRTRTHHRKLDGQLRELDEDFEVSGMKVKAPGYFGRPSEDCNCRCALSQRARWALDEAELETLKQRAEYYELDKTEDFEDYKKKYLKAVKGLGANDGLFEIPEHKKPEIIDNIDFNDKKAVKSILQKFEIDAVEETIETACVITNDGTVYKCYGVEDRVFPDFDLGDKLIGAKVSHNHPEKYTQYSFSSDDLALFNNYQLEILRGVDHKYKYAFSRNPNEIDEHISIFDIMDEDSQHEDMITKAEAYEIGYRRWKNDQRAGTS